MVKWLQKHGTLKEYQSREETDDESESEDSNGPNRSKRVRNEFTPTEDMILARFLLDNRNLNPATDKTYVPLEKVSTVTSF